MFKRKNPVFPLPFLPPPPPPPTGGREKGKEKLDFAASTLSFNKQYLHSSHQICVEKYYFMFEFMKSSTTNDWALETITKVAKCLFLTC